MESELYRVEQFPVLQNRMYVSVQDAINCPCGDIRLVQNLTTGLIYNAEFCPELMSYDTHYQNEQAGSPIFRQHLSQVAEIVERSMGCDGLVEIGCGKGYFLEMLLERGCDINGFDPAYEGTNRRVQRKYYEQGIEVTAKGIILRHVLEHVQNPVNFLRELSDANDGRGLIYIEVPCFEWIIAHKAWFDIFYEHVNYFRLKDFQRMFGRILESGHLFGNQYIYIVADLSTLKYPKIDDHNDLMHMPKDFLKNIESRAEPSRAEPSQ